MRRTVLFVCISIFPSILFSQDLEAFLSEKYLHSIALETISELSKCDPDTDYTLIHVNMMYEPDQHIKNAHVSCHYLGATFNDYNGIKELNGISNIYVETSEFKYLADFFNATYTEEDIKRTSDDFRKYITKKIVKIRTQTVLIDFKRKKGVFKITSIEIKMHNTAYSAIGRPY